MFGGFVQSSVSINRCKFALLEWHLRVHSWKKTIFFFVKTKQEGVKYSYFSVKGDVFFDTSEWMFSQCICNNPLLISAQVCWCDAGSRKTKSSKASNYFMTVTQSFHNRVAFPLTSYFWSIMIHFNTFHSDASFKWTS